MKILVVCGAGASSTFVAQRLQRAADADGLDVSVSATTLTRLADELASADLVLVGPHLSDRQEQLRQDAAPHGTRVALLPRDVFGDLDGSRTLVLVRTALDAGIPSDTVTALPREDPS